MLFAGSVDDGTLLVFDTVALATSYCEGVDVEDGVWKFWDAEGNSLRPEFSVPNHRGRFAVGNGVFHLVPDPTGQALALHLPDFRSMEPNRHYGSLKEVRAKFGSGVPGVGV
jgi:hypothetical protein